MKTRDLTHCSVAIVKPVGEAGVNHFDLCELISFSHHRTFVRPENG